MTDYTTDIERICDEALRAASTRKLTQDEIAALRWAAGIPERRPTARDSGMEIDHGIDCI
jgi:chorismate mutase